MVVISGEVTKPCVSGLPSLRLAKLRLYDVTIVFASPAFSWRFHCPMHGPHALASTVAPASSNTSVKPSRVMVARTCSEPGVTRNGAVNLSPAALACCTSATQRAMSS